MKWDVTVYQFLSIALRLYELILVKQETIISALLQKLDRFYLYEEYRLNLQGALSTLLFSWVTVT